MEFLWFLAALVFFVLWLDARSKNTRSAAPTHADADYSQGYWDGYRAFGDKVEAMLGDGSLSKQKLLHYVKEGNKETNTVATDAVPMLEELGIIADDVDEYSDDEPQIFMQQAAAQPALSEKDIEAEKEKRTLQNLNTLLYVGSFLIVAAAALFVTLVMPPVVKLTSLILVMVAFYVSGLMIHSRSVRLQPAATAFIGTGLAIIPFVGFALTSLGGLSGANAWLITSLVGLFAYGYAAVRIQSQLVSYLTMAFVLSLAMSAVSTLSLSMVWYFIALMGVSIVCNTAQYLWPKRVPALFAAPIEQTGQFTTPVALAASFFTMEYMDLFMYEVLFGVATAHYMVVWLQQRDYIYEAAVRGLGHIALLLIGYDLATVYNWHEASFGVWWLMLAAAQAVYSLARVRTADTKSVGVENIWLVSALGAIFVGMSLWTMLDAMWVWVSVSLVVVGAISLAATIKLRQAEWAYLGLGVSLLLPYVLGRGVIEPVVSYEVIAGIFAVLALLALVALDRALSLGRSQAAASLLAAAVVAYSSLIVLSGMMADSMVTIGSTTLLSGGIFLLLSYPLKSAAIEIVGVVLGVVSVGAWVHNSSLASEWWLLVSATVSAALLVCGALVHHARAEQERRDGLLGLGAIVFATIVFSGLSFMGVAVLRTATLLLLVAGIAGLCLRLVLQHPGSLIAHIAKISCAVFPTLALPVSIQAGDGWPALVFAVAAVTAWIASYIEKTAWLLSVGNAALVCALYIAWSWLGFDSMWQIYGVAWLSMGVFYATYWLMVDKRDEVRQWISLLSIWVVLGWSVIYGIFDVDPQHIMMSAGSLLLIAATLAVHGYLHKKRDYIEIAAYLATFGLQRIASTLLPEINFVFYGHWWALVIAFVAWWRKGADYQVRLMGAMVLVTGSTGVYALMGIPGYSLVFLIEHLIVLTVGAVLRQQWVMWWGIIAVIVAVLYFLRGFTFLALLFLGFLLILFVIWRLTKITKR